MPEIPSGTVTFLFTDIEGSTKRWEHDPGEMAGALKRHDDLLSHAIRASGGYVFKTVGDAFCAAFQTAAQAVAAALQAQASLLSWGREGQATEPVLVRMALHTGETEERDGDYFGPPVNRVARLLSTGYGGQTLLSEVTQALVRDSLPKGAVLRDLGEHRLKDLFRPERIYQLVAPDLPSDFPSLKTLDARPNNLPSQPTLLIGRESEVEAVVKLLSREDARLVTLTGPGGTGKTRLALQAAAEMVDRFEDGVCFVDLAPLTDPALVVPEIARTLGVREQGGRSPLDSLAEYLKTRQILLVMDNYEHLTGAAEVAGRLLQAAPALKILATSRVPLHIRGEKEYAVPPLRLPDFEHLPPLEQLTQYEAVRLFIDRATDVKGGFQVDNSNAPAVAEVCARLDGLPLAIELAAARVKFLSPQAILTRLQSRLKLLTGGARDVHARHQTLRNTIAWSHDLLSEQEQLLFRRLAAFQGGRSLEAVEAICNADGDLEIDSLDGISSLVDKSLLRQEEGVSREPRYVMLETIHEFARERLEQSGEAEATGRRHALYFMALAEEAEQHFTGRKQVDWLNRIGEEHDNMRAALRWARGAAGGEQSGAEALEIGLRTAGAVYRFWEARGYFTEGRELLAVLLSIAGGTGAQDEASSAVSKGKVKALLAAARLAHLQSDLLTERFLAEQALAMARDLEDKASMAAAFISLGNVAGDEEDHATARAMFEQSLAIRRELGDKRGVAALLNNLAGMAGEEGDDASARSLYEQSLDIFRELDDKTGMTYPLFGLGGIAYEEGDYPRARSLFEQALALHRELGSKPGIAYALSWLGNITWREGDHAGGRSLYEQSLEIYRELGDKWRIGYWSHRQGLWAYEEGDYAAAHPLIRQGLSLWNELGDKRWIAAALAGLGGAAAAQQHWVRATRLLGAAEALLGSLGQVLESDDRVLYDQGIAAAHAELGQEFEAAMQEGRDMSMEQAISYALEEG
jgi:predicted ATPase/class 3 adenylate cyclase